MQLTEEEYKEGRKREFHIPGVGMAFTFGDRQIKIEGQAPMPIEEALRLYGDKLVGKI